MIRELFIIISVCTPNNTHAEMFFNCLVKILERFVWCEKPMSSSLNDSVEMVNASKISRSKTIIGFFLLHNYTKNPIVLHAKKIIDNRRQIRYI